MSYPLVDLTNVVQAAHFILSSNLEVLSEKRFFSSKEATDVQLPSSSGEDVLMNDINVVQPKTKPN